jgi:hypothetical protein
MAVVVAGEDSQGAAGAEDPPVGGTSAMPINARIIAATNKNRALVVTAVREDLFYGSTCPH